MEERKDLHSEFPLGAGNAGIPSAATLISAIASEHFD
jgi:hypothetical protein